MIAIVCGGREFTDRESAFKALDEAMEAFGLTKIIHGGARGADWFAMEWARARNVPTSVYGADWNKHGKAAGPLRNQEMLDHSGAEIVLAFPGGSGTADMVRRAKAAGLVIYEFTPNEGELDP